MAKKNREVVMNAKQDPVVVAAAAQANSADLQQMMDSIERFKSRNMARKIKNDLPGDQDDQALSEGASGEVVSDSGAPLQMAQASIVAPAVEAASSAAAASSVAGALAGGISPIVGGALGVGGLALASGTSAQSDVDALKSSTDAKDAELQTSINAKAAALKASIDELAADIEDALDLKADAADLLTLKGRFDTARTELDALKTLADGTQADLETLQSDYDQAKTDFQGALDALAGDLRDEIAALKSDIEDALDLKADAADLLTLKGRFDTARAELDALKTLADGTQADLETLQSDLDQAKTDFQDALDALAGDLRDEIAALKSDIEDALDLKADAADLLTLKGRFDTARTELDALKTLADGTQADLETLQSAFDDANDDINASIAAIEARLDALEAQPAAWDGDVLELTAGQIFEDGLDHSQVLVGGLSAAVLDPSASVDNLGVGSDDDNVIESVKIANVSVGFKFDAGEDGIFESGDVVSLALNYGVGEDSAKTFEYTLSADMDADALGQAVLNQMNQDGFFDSTGMSAGYNSQDDELVVTSDGALFTGDQPVNLADLEDGFTVPAGFVYTSISDSLALLGTLFDTYISGENINVDVPEADAFVTEWISSHLVTSGDIEVPAGRIFGGMGGEDGLIMLDAAGQQGLQQLVDFTNEVADTNIPVNLMDILNRENILSLDLSSSFLDQIEGFDPATVTAHVTNAMTVAQASVLAEHGFDMANNVEFKIDDYFQNITSATNNPKQVAILQNATSDIVARGTEVADEMQFGAPELAGVPLTIFADAGDDKIAAGYGRDVIVGQQGADEIILTTRSRSGDYLDEDDTIVYETAFDGASFKEITFGGFTASEDDYREGGLVTVTINETVVNYTITGEDVATFATNDSSDDIDARDYVLQKLAQEIASADGLDIGEDQIDVIAGQGLIRIKSVGFGEPSHCEWLQASEAELRVSDQITVTFSSVDSDYYSDDHSDNFIQLVFTDSLGIEKTFTQSMIASRDLDDVVQLNNSSDSEVSFVFSADGSDDTFDKGDDITLSFNVASQDHVYTMTLSQDMSTDALGQAYADMINSDETLGEDVVATYHDATDTLVLTGDMPSSGALFNYSAGVMFMGEDSMTVNGSSSDMFLWGSSSELTIVLDGGSDDVFNTPMYFGAYDGLNLWSFSNSSNQSTDVLGLAMSEDAALDLGKGYIVSYDDASNTLSITGPSGGAGSGLFTNVSGEDSATDINNAYGLGDAVGTVTALTQQMNGKGGLDSTKYIVNQDGTSITIQAKGDAYDDESFDFDIKEHSITVASDDTVSGALYSGSEEFSLSADGLYSETTVHFTSEDNDYTEGSTIQLTTVGADGMAGNSDDLVFSYTITSDDRVGDFSLNAISKLVDVINSVDDTGFDASVSGDDVILTRNTFGAEKIDVVGSDTYIFASSLDLPYEATLAWTETGRSYAQGNTMTLSFTVFDTETGSNGDFTFSYELTASDDSSPTAAVGNFAAFLTQKLSAESLEISVSVDDTDLNVLHITGPSSGHPLLWNYDLNGIFNSSAAEVGDSVNITEGDGADNEGLTWWAQSADLDEKAGLPVTLHFDYDNIDVFDRAHIGVHIGSQDFDVALKFTDMSSETVNWDLTLNDLVTLINAASLDITASLDLDKETLVLDGVQSITDATAFATNRNSSMTTVVVERVEQDLNRVNADGTDGGLTLLETGSNSGHDVITGFNRDTDVIAIDGDLLARMGNRDNVDFTFVESGYISSVDIDVELDMTGVVLVSREMNRNSVSDDVYVSDMTSAEDVALLLNDLFEFSAGIDGVLNTTVFNIVAADNKYASSLWVHTQAHDADDTVEAEELSLLATVCTTDVNGLGMSVDPYAFTTDNFAMSHLFPTNQAYSVLPPA